VLAVPARLTDARDGRSAETVDVVVRTEVRLAPGVRRVDLQVDVTNPAEDHRLRLRFPTGAPVARFRAATTFDVAERSTGAVDDAGWQHPAPRTFPHQGWIEANGLVVEAPGLPEAEVSPEGTILVTLLRSVGWLARLDPTTRPIPAGPGLVTPEAQCPQGISARLALRLVGDGEAMDVAALAACDEQTFRGVPAGDAPLLASGASLLSVGPASVVLSALKPAEDGIGMVIRVANPTASAVEAEIVLGLPVSEARSVRLDETPDDLPLDHEGACLRMTIGPHGLRTVRVRVG
jgi:mannosylglycerate hydrolase